jgi:hypothetical protein
LKFNELENRVDLLVNRVLELEQQVRTLTESQGDIPPGMAPSPRWRLSSAYRRKSRRAGKKHGRDAGQNESWWLYRAG